MSALNLARCVKGKVYTLIFKFINNQDIHEVVSKIPNLSRLQMLKVVRLLMSSNPGEFSLLKSLPDDENTEWILFLISQSEGQFPFGLLLLGRYHFSFFFPP